MEFAPGGLDKLKHHLQGRYLARDRKAAGVVLPPQEILVHEIDFDSEKYPLQWKYMKQLKKYNQIVLRNKRQIYDCSCCYYYDSTYASDECLAWRYSD
jgi:hypothetical protein